MSRSVSFLLICHNTAEFPIRLGIEIAHEALGGGKFHAVRRFSFREPVHTLLLPMIGQAPSTFDHHCLTIQMPWKSKAVHVGSKRETKAQEKDRLNRTKYATAFIEACEGIEQMCDEDFFSMWFSGEVQRRLLDVAADANVLFVINDIRHMHDIGCVRAKFPDSRILLLRSLSDVSQRRDVVCGSLDSSTLEGFAASADARVFDFVLDEPREGYLNWVMERVNTLA